MNLSRFSPKFTVRRLMVAVAIVAVLIGLIVRRPRPRGTYSDARHCWVVWSDGTSTEQAAMPKLRGNSWLLIIDWADGSTSYYPWLPVSPAPTKP
jgi:hypothetical protein